MMNLLLLITLFIILILFILINHYFKSKLIFENFYNELSINLNKNDFNSYLLDNYKSNKIFNVKVIKNKQDLNECFKKCDFENCIKLKLMKENYDKCISCQKNDSKCYNKLLYEGRCDPCGKNLEKTNCSDINNFACPNLKDIYNINGIEPYYLQVNNKENITSPYKQSCLFCWNLKNYL